MANLLLQGRTGHAMMGEPEMRPPGPCPAGCVDRDIGPAECDRWRRILKVHS